MQSSLYRGRVMHRRHRPVLHELSYRLYMSYLDLSELPEILDGHLFWSARRPAPVRFAREDHFGDPGQPLDESVRTLVAEQTGHRPRGPIRLLTNLRHFGYVFNPVSLFYCFDPSDERLDALVAEVSNTPWNERHCYVLDLRGEPPSGQRAEHPKEFHVSPFMRLDQRYDWSVSVPGETLTVRIDSAEAGEKIFDATLSLERVELSTASMAATLARFPLMTAKVMAGIHWEALKLWLKRVPVVPHPGPVREAGRPPGEDASR